MSDKYALHVEKEEKDSVHLSDATARVVEGPKPTPKTCPFVGVAVPNMDRKSQREFPIVMETRECNASCALFDEAKDRTCLERVFAFFSERKA